MDGLDRGHASYSNEVGLKRNLKERRGLRAGGRRSASGSAIRSGALGRNSNLFIFQSSRTSFLLPCCNVPVQLLMGI